MIETFLSALALVFVLEGILPFICPDCWRSNIQKLCAQENRVLRILGLISMIIGVVLLTFVHQFLY